MVNKMFIYYVLIQHQRYSTTNKYRHFAFQIQSFNFRSIVTRYWEMQTNYRIFQMYRSLVFILKYFVHNNTRVRNRKVSICGSQMVLQKLVTACIDHKLLSKSYITFGEGVIKFFAKVWGFVFYRIRYFSVVTARSLPCVHKKNGKCLKQILVSVLILLWQLELLVLCSGVILKLWKC